MTRPTAARAHGIINIEHSKAIEQDDRDLTKARSGCPTLLPLATRHRIDPPTAYRPRWKLALLPGLAAVLAAIDLSMHGAAIDVGRVSTVNGDLRHPARRGITDIDTFPCLRR